MKVFYIFCCVVVLAGCTSPVYEPLPADFAAEAPPATSSDEPQFVYVRGEVRRPGPQPFLGRMTVVRAIEMAVGFTDAADPRRLIIRRSDETVERYNYYRILGDTTNCPCLNPGDTLEVQRKRFLLLW